MKPPEDLNTKVEIRKLEADIAKWRTERRKKKFRGLYLWVLANLLMLTSVFLYPFISLLFLPWFVLGLLIFGAFVWYSYNALWKDKTGDALFERAKRMKGALFKQLEETKKEQVGD